MDISALSPDVLIWLQACRFFSPFLLEKLQLKTVWRKTIDFNLGRRIREIEKSDYVLIITADHGNAEKMFDPQVNQPYTAHTENPAPFAVMKKDLKLSGKEDCAARLRQSWK